MDPVLSHTLSAFRIMFIPHVLLKSLPPVLSSLLISLLPVTPINLIIFFLVLTIIYTTDMFHLSKKETYSCRKDTLVKKSSFSLWTLIKNTYYYYFMIAFAVNLITLTDFQMLNVNAIQSMT
jgi:hypothetical protein